MIGLLRGAVASKSESLVIVDVGGVGYEVHVSKTDVFRLPAVGDHVALEIHTHVAEGIFQLFGFVTPAEKSIFRKLISVSGIGPKSALAIVSALPISNLVAAIQQGDLHTLTSLPGVGKKTAERLLIELKDKFKEIGTTQAFAGVPLTKLDSVESDALQALLSLGYSDQVARRALKAIERDAQDSVQVIIKKSLGALAV